MINVYGENTTNFDNNGLATLIPLSAEFSSDINGAWTLSITHPYDAEGRYKHLVKNAILQADVGCIREQSSKQLFRIYDVKKNLQSLSIIAFPIGMEATFDAPIEELKIPNETGVLTASGVDAAAVLDNYVKTHDDNDKYTVSSNVATQSRSQWENTNLIAAISGSDDNSFVNKWGGEVLYDNFAITIKNKLGNDIKFPVLYGRNLMGLEEDLDMSSVITRAFPISEDGLRLHDYDDVDIDYWYGTFEDGEPKNWAASQDLYSYEFGTWYRFDEHGKMLVDAIPAEDLAWLAQYEWHEDSTGWWYGCDSVHYIANGWVEDANGKHYWMDAQGYMDSSKTDTDVWTWNQYDDGNMHHGDKRLSYVDSEEVRKGTYPYIRSAFLNAPYGLLDTDSKSYSTTAIATRNWTTLLYNAIYDKAEELWNTALEDLINVYCPEYLQEIIEDISKYTQARYAYSHKGWQSLIKSCISSGLSWIKDVDLDEEGWIEINGWMYGDFDSDGNFKNYPKNQYIYSYENSKWYWFDEAGIMSTDEIPAEDLAWLNNCDWRRDDVGQYYGDGQGHYIAYGWVENSNGTHSWVNAQGYYEAQYDDSDTWEWTEISGWKYGRSKTQYAVNEYVLIDKNLEWFGGDGFWRDWMRVPAEDMGWYQVKDGANAGKWWYGSLNRYYAHNEFVYVTVDGTMEEWWYDKEGWYDADSSGESDFGWHGDESTGIWFGEEDAGTGDKNKYIHDKWAYIDGTYYWFDSDGYISGDASKAKQDWAWGDQVDEVTGKHWFGNTDESFNRMWLASQYMKIDNEWYFFDADGYMVDRDTKKSQTISWFSNEIVTALNPVADLMLKAAYDLLYTQMTAWVQKQFEDGLDKPQITVSVNLVDLSKTSEYAEYADLEKIYLGDSVKCVDTVHDMSIDARVVGLTYDLIRGYNTKVTIGQLAKNLSQILSVSYQGSGKDTSVDNIIAGDGVKKDGNVISVSDTPGTSYGIQDVIFEGASLVSGNVAVLDEVIPEVIDVVANPEAEATDDLTKLQVDGVVYQILGGGGLQYWIETENEIYRMGKVDGISTNVDGYIFDYSEWSTRNSISQLYAQFDFKKANDKLAICAKIYNLYNTRNLYFVLISTDAEAIEWVYRNPMLYSEFLSPEEGMASHNDDRYRGKDTASFVYGGYTWYISMGSFGPASYTCTSDFLTFVPSETDTLADLGIDLLETIGGKGYTDVKTGIGNADKILYQKVGNNFVAYLDDTGAFEGTDYKVNGESLITKINSKQDKLIQGENITIGADGKTISANGNIAGETIPVSSEGNNNAIYMQYSTTGGETGYETIWTGSASTSAWASPVKIGTINPSEYYRIKITGTRNGEKLVSEIPAVGSGDLWHLGHEMYIFTANDCTELWLYSSTGYSNTVTKVEATIYDEGLPSSIDAIYGKVRGHWLEIGGSSESFFEVVNGELCQVYDDGQ